MTSPIVVFGDDWGRHVSSMQHVFRHIVDRRPVIWVNAIGHRIPTLRASDMRRAWEKARAMLSPRTSPSSGWMSGPTPLATIRPRVLPWHNLGAVRAFNTWSLVRSIRQALEANRLTERPILVTGSPPSVGVVGRLDEAAVVYFCMDDFLHLPGVTVSMIGPLEEELLGRVDAVVATAQALTQSKRPRSGRAHYLPQGVNFEHFSNPMAVPEDLKALPRPVIGFSGGVSGACDVALIRKVAAAFPNATVALIGPVVIDPALLKAPNIHLMGSRPYGVLPGYVQAFDVGIVPYVLNDWTRAVDPLKLLEYLAAGLPVVSTALPEVLKYQEAVAVAEDHDAFVGAIKGVLSGDRTHSRARAQELARRHTWARRADELLGILDALAASKAEAPAVMAGGSATLL